MIKPKFNRTHTIIQGFFTAIVMILLLAHCATVTPLPSPISPWSTLQQAATAAPQQQIALLTQGGPTLLAWPTGPGLSTISLWDSQPTADQPVQTAPDSENPLTLILGTTPRDVRMYPAGGGTVQLLWLDQPLPNENTLYTALLDADHKIERGPTTVSNRPTLQYAAAAAPDGSLYTFWIGDNSLYAELVDTAGRPHPPLLIAAPAAYPAAAYDNKGLLHVAWLEAGSARLWTIHYATFKGDPAATDGVPGGVFRLSDAESLDGFHLALDSANVYLLWNTSLLASNGTITGQLAGVTFPIGSPNASQALNIAASANTSILALAVPPRPMTPLLIGLTVSRWDGHNWQDIPVAMPLTPQGSGSLLPVITLGSGENGITGQPSIDQDSSGSVVLAWASLRDNGTAAIFYAAAPLRLAGALTPAATQPVQ